MPNDRPNPWILMGLTGTLAVAYALWAQPFSANKQLELVEFFYILSFFGLSVAYGGHLLAEKRDPDGCWQIVMIILVSLITVVWMLGPMLYLYIRYFRFIFGKDEFPSSRAFLYFKTLILLVSSYFFYAFFNLALLADAQEGEVEQQLGLRLRLVETQAEARKEAIEKLYQDLERVDSEQAQVRINETRTYFLDTGFVDREKELVTTKYTRVNQEQLLPDPCRMCQLGIKEKEEVSSIGCAHLFHLKCFQTWTTRFAVCPVCRVSYRETLVKNFMKKEN